MTGSLHIAKLWEIAALNPVLGVALKGDDQVTFIPMSAVDAETATTDNSASRCYSDVSKGFTPFLNGDVLVAKITPCFENGKIAQARLGRQVGFGSTEFHVVRPHPNQADARYVLHFLRQERVRLEGEQKMTGSAGQRRVPEHFLAGLRIPLPPLPQQRQIVEVLDRTEALRAKRRAALARIDALTQAIFFDMFGDPATNPKGWPTSRVSDYVAEFRGGKSIEAESGDRAVTRNRVLKVSAVTGMKYLPEESKPAPDSYEPPDEHFVRSGDLLFSRANTTDLVGAVALVVQTPPHLLLPDKLWRFVWRQPVVAEPVFVWALFQTPKMRYEIGRRATGTSGSMKNISQEKVLGIRTILPPIDAQRDFAISVTKAEEVKATHRTSLSALDALFASLQHRAFRGQI